MPEPKASDKMPLEDYVFSILDQMAAAADRFEVKHLKWMVQTSEMTPRAVLKPIGGRVYVDIDEPAKAAWSEVPIKMVRVPGAE